MESRTPPEAAMTVTTLTYAVAHEHINDLLRDAERRHLAAEVRSTRRRFRLPIARFARRPDVKALAAGTPV